MKIKILLGLIFIFAFSSIAFAQTVKITPKKITYTRPKPSADFKKTFTINYPKIKASTPALSKKIENSISYAKIVSLDIDDEKNGENQWLEEADYDVNYNKNGILDITLSMSGTAAYPTVMNRTVVVNLKTGSRAMASDVFINLKGLAAMVKKAQEAEIKESIEEIKEEEDYRDFDPKNFFEYADFTVEDLEQFTISDEGVTFMYSYGFPRVAMAVEPAGNYAFAWSELKPYIKRGGLLARIAG